MAKVALTSTKTKNFSTEDISNAVNRAFDLLDFSPSNRIEKIVIKPNLSYYSDYSTGETTDPRVVSAVIDYVRDIVDKDVRIFVAEADATAMKTKYSFKVLGYEKLRQTKNIELMNLSHGNIIEKKVNVRNRELVLPVNEILLDGSLIINVPKLKTHNVVGFTCSLKNMFGAIAKPRKYDYHKMLSDVIVGINKIVRCNMIVVDGIIAKGSEPKKLGVLVAGNNPLATDSIAAEIMGFNPRKVEYLKLAEEENIGNLSNIDLVEDNIKLREIKNRFPTYSHFRHKISWQLQLKMLRTYAAITGDVLPPVLEK